MTEKEKDDVTFVRTKLVGWKKISRHLGRSERTTQLWEAGRGLPVHRIPGARGQTVYAYVDELDAWADGTSPAPHANGTGPSTVPPSAAQRAVAAATAPAPVTRPPGILVLPFDNLAEAADTPRCDALSQQMIVRLAAVQQSVRVLSWTTSRTMRHALDPLDAIATRLNVRYLVEGAMARRADTIHVDVRVVDAELDHVLLADRLALSAREGAADEARAAAAVALHFALVHRGALVESTCIADVAPAVLLDYVHGAWHFADRAAGAPDRAVAALDRALARDPAFAPALALRGLALLQVSSDATRCAEARRIASTCAGESSTRITLPFLEAALAIAAGLDEHTAQRGLAEALRRVSPAIVRRGRLYDRRSPLRPRRDERLGASPTEGMPSHGPATDSPSFVEDLLTRLAACEPRDAVRGPTAPTTPFDPAPTPSSTPICVPEGLVSSLGVPGDVAARARG